MLKTKPFATILFLVVAALTLVNYGVEFADRRLILNLDNVLLALGWPLVCLGGILYLWQDGLSYKLLSVVLFLAKIAITVYLGISEGKNLFMLKSFWIDVVIVCTSLYILFFYPFPRRKKAE